MPRDLSPPAFLFYPDDFAGDGKVEAMSTEGVGCYILLLCKAWRENPPATIPDDDRLLARWARVSDDRWNSLRTEVLSTFDPTSSGRLIQKRLRREYEKQRRNSKLRSDSGKLGAAVRWQTHGKRYGDAIAKESESEDENEIKNGSVRKSGKFKPPTVEEVASYCAERKNTVDAQLFVDHYEANGWVQGRQGKPLKDWRAAVRTWEKNDFGRKQTPKHNSGRPGGAGERSL